MGEYYFVKNLQKVLQYTIFYEYKSQIHVGSLCIFAPGGAKGHRHPVYRGIWENHQNKLFLAIFTLIIIQVKKMT